MPLSNYRRMSPIGTISRSEQSARQQRQLPLSGEIVAYVLVAICGIVPQAPVEWKRLIKLLDPLAGVVDRRRNVGRRGGLGQRQRWCALNWRDVRTAAAARGDPGTWRALSFLLPCGSGALPAFHALHDDRRSIARRNLRRRTLGAGLPLGAGRRGCIRPEDENGAGKSHHPEQRRAHIAKISTFSWHRYWHISRRFFVQAYLSPRHREEINARRGRRPSGQCDRFLV